MQKEELQKILNQQTKELKQDYNQQTKELKKDYGRQGKFLLEEFDKKTRIIAEVQVEHTKKFDEHGRKLDEHGRKLDAIMEMVAKNTVDIDIIKGMLRKKVDMEEFETLEKRVSLLERKLRPA